MGRLAVVAAAMLMVAGVFAISASTAAAAEKALVYGPSVSGGASSTEAQEAAAKGYTVDVVDNATWQSMTGAQFGAYRAIIIGDTGFTSNTTYNALASNASTWGPQVDGNTIIVGTDPQGHPEGETVTRRGVDFALDEPDKTGAYITLSDAHFSSSSPPAFLNGIGTFTVQGATGCFERVHIVATHPALTGLTDASLSNWGCSVHTVFASWPSGFEALAMATDAGASYTAPDGTRGVPYILARGAGLSTSNISLTPGSATAPTGTTHTVTATILSGGSPVPGRTVTFSITAGPNAGTTGSDVTDANGQATFGYVGATAGTDSIVASFVDGGGNTQTSNPASVTWQAPTNSAPALVLPGNQSGQYSDALSFAISATDSDAGDTLTLSATGLPAGLTFTDNGNRTGSIAGTLNAAPGTFPVQFTVNDGHNTPVTDSVTITIAREDCTLAYTGDTLVAPLANTNLAAQLGEPDTSLGDRSSKSISFTLTDASAVAQSHSAVTNATGLATKSVALPANVYGVVAAFGGDTYYLLCASPAAPNDTLITVQAAGSKTTGGGWFSSPSRTNFGFNLIPEAGGLWKGQLQLRTNNGKSRFHADAVSSAAQTASNSMRWTGTGKWNGTSGYTYEVTVVDNGSSGSKKGDTISIKVFPTGQPSNPVFNSGAPQSLKGGNITVHG